MILSIFLLGLGKASQGISTALSVEKTSKRGGKIVNLAAEQGEVSNNTCYVLILLKTGPSFHHCK